MHLTASSFRQPTVSMKAQSPSRAIHFLFSVLRAVWPHPKPEGAYHVKTFPPASPPSRNFAQGPIQRQGFAHPHRCRPYAPRSAGFHRGPGASLTLAPRFVRVCPKGLPAKTRRAPLLARPCNAPIPRLRADPSHLAAPSTVQTARQASAPMTKTQASSPPKALCQTILPSKHPTKSPRLRPYLCPGQQNQHLSPKASPPNRAGIWNANRRRPALSLACGPTRLKRPSFHSVGPEVLGSSNEEIPIVLAEAFETTSIGQIVDCGRSYCPANASSSSGKNRIS